MKTITYIQQKNNTYGFLSKELSESEKRAYKQAEGETVTSEILALLNDGELGHVQDYCRARIKEIISNK